jgi:hypothetical protein
MMGLSAHMTSHMMSSDARNQGCVTGARSPALPHTSRVQAHAGTAMPPAARARGDSPLRPPAPNPRRYW